MSKIKITEKLSEIDAHVTKYYDIIHRLGKGAYGIVWKAIDKRRKETVAVKKIFDAFRNQTDAQRTFREIVFLMSFANHENIIQLIGLHKANNNRDIYLIFEYMETDLHNVIKRRSILKDIHKVYIMYQLLKAIKYVHSGNVIHRDLKPSNILLNVQCHCKIADFGLARSVSHFEEGGGICRSDPTLTDYVATRWYRAPEILIASKSYTKGIDMWSLGCIFGEMLLGKPLFPGSSTINQIERIMATLPPPTKDDLASVNSSYGSNLLQKSPSSPHRSLDELLPCVSADALDLIKNLIVFNPNRRLTAVEALEHPYIACFHIRGNEPEKGSSVIPFLRDDIQLSVDEYRNKLYSMMDEKHLKYKTISKSEIKYLSKHTRKGPNYIAENEIVAKKSSHIPYDNLRKEKRKSDTDKILYREVKCPSVASIKNIPVQYACNLRNGSFQRFTPNHETNCLYLSVQQREQQEVWRSQRLMQLCNQCASRKSEDVQQMKYYVDKEGIVSRSIAVVNQQKYCSPIKICNQPLMKCESKFSQEKSKILCSNKYTTTFSQNMLKPIIQRNQVTCNYLSIGNHLQQQQHKQTLKRHSQNRFKSANVALMKNTQQTSNNSDNNFKLNNKSHYSKSFKCYGRNHGIISASMYRDLRKDTIDW